MIRTARADDFARLQDIEVAAGRAFAAAGMSSVAADDPFPAAELRQFQRAGRAWVVADEHDVPIAYLLAEWVDGNVHIEQVSTHPDAAGRGLGRDLIEHVAQWARERAAPALTLTTFVEVPWNGPYYERLGFRRLAPEEETAGLRAIRAAESAHGLDQWPRCCMRRELTTGA
jgi:GNAT superfamily N-acetyltransferase